MWIVLFLLLLFESLLRFRFALLLLFFLAVENQL